MFAACATMIVVGGSFERGRILPSIIFGFCWWYVLSHPFHASLTVACGWLSRMVDCWPLLTVDYRWRVNIVNCSTPLIDTKFD
jgi:ammonia channel protein AmtB